MLSCPLSKTLTHPSLRVWPGDDSGRSRRRSKKRSLLGSLRRRLGGSKSRSQSTEPGAARQDWEDEPGRSASLDRRHYLTVPRAG